MEEKSLRDELQDIKGILEEQQTKKPKKFKLPLKARVTKGKLKNGYITIATIHENKAVDFVREPVIDGTIKLDDTIHSIDAMDIFNYKGRPLIFQAKNKLNPYNPLSGINETYGQKYVMARMEGDKIIGKKKVGLGMSIGVLIIVAVIVYALFTGGS